MLAHAASDSLTTNTTKSVIDPEDLPNDPVREIALASNACSELRCLLKTMGTFAKKLGQHGYPFFLQKKLEKFLQQTIRADKTNFEIKERCRDWPHCTSMECKFIHPLAPCRYGDACQKREICLFLHGEDYLHVYTVVESQWDLTLPLTEPIPLEKSDK
ncbi:hypothetical protein ACTXT7_013705 [Hymenolepis weldensis]